MKNKILMFFYFIFSTKYVNAKIEIAYIEIKDLSGKTLQLEPNGQFAHIAISYKNKWLHAYPYKGVEIITEAQLRHIGNPIKVTYDFINELSDSEINNFLGKQYDYNFSWNNDKIYCSELVAKLLKINPLPMIFSSSVWHKNRRNNTEYLGLSPDDIFRIMAKRKKDFLNLRNSCYKLFST